MWFTTIDFKEYTFLYPLLAFFVILGTHVAYGHVQRRWRVKQALTAARLAKRRRAGIPDSDKRPWLIACPEAELRRREEVAAKAAAAAEGAERKRLQAKQEEIEEWGKGALKIVQRLRSPQNMPLNLRERARRVDRRRDHDEPIGLDSVSVRGPAMWPPSPARPHSTFPAPFTFMERRDSEPTFPPPSGLPGTGPLFSVPRQPSLNLPPHLPLPLSRSHLRPPFTNRLMGKRTREFESEDEGGFFTSGKRQNKGRTHTMRVPSTQRRRFGMARQSSTVDAPITGDQDVEMLEVAVGEGASMNEGRKRSRVEDHQPRKRIRQLSASGVEHPRPLFARYLDAPNNLPVCGSATVSFAHGTPWTDASGVEWFETQNGTRLRQTDIAGIAVLKYHMPRDSQHPDARAEVIAQKVRVWIEENEYNTLKAQGRLEWKAEDVLVEQEDKETIRAEPPSSALLMHTVGASRPADTSSAKQVPRRQTRYYADVADFDRQLSLEFNSPSRGRLNSPPRFGATKRISYAQQRRQLNQAGITKRQDGLLSRLGRADGGMNGHAQQEKPTGKIILHSLSPAAEFAVQAVPVENDTPGDESACAWTAGTASEPPLAVPRAEGNPAALKPTFTFGAAMMALLAEEPAESPGQETKTKPATFMFGATSAPQPPVSVFLSNVGQKPMFSFGAVRASPVTVTAEKLDNASPMTSNGGALSAFPSTQPATQIGEKGPKKRVSFASSALSSDMSPSPTASFLLNANPNGISNGLNGTFPPTATAFAFPNEKENDQPASSFTFGSSTFIATTQNSSAFAFSTSSATVTPGAAPSPPTTFFVGPPTPAVASAFAQTSSTRSFSFGA